MYVYWRSGRNDGRHPDEMMESRMPTMKINPMMIEFPKAYHVTPQAVSNLCATYVLGH